LTLLLERNGAQPAPLGEATHIITLSLDYEGQDGAKEGSVTVTDFWVDRSFFLGRLQLAQHFSPDPAMLFSGVVACVTDVRLSPHGRKLIGSLTWLFHVEYTGTIGAPTAQLLHYPVPKKSIEGFSAHAITVTNYTGDAHRYLIKLIGLMGATFTPSMSWRNTISGRKATKARDWSIPVVNHTWLEDCFIRWKTLSVGLEKYVAFPPGLDFSNHLGE
ncbi:hypothetical protein BJV77DRAFT_919798, partial [Russula vinacea]